MTGMENGCVKDRIEELPRHAEGTHGSRADLLSRGRRPLGSIMHGMARMFDFTNSLSLRLSTSSAEEDMALVWREVFSLLPSPRDAHLLAVRQSDETNVVDSVPVPSQNAPRQGGQGVLFQVPDRTDIGYRGPTACAAAGVTYRQLDYWARTGLVEPSVRAARGSGSERLYSFRDLLVLKAVKRLLDTGVGLSEIRAALRYFREKSTKDLAEVTLMSDGVSVYAATSPDEIVDLLQGGQAVFGIALGGLLREVEGSLEGLPTEPVQGYQQAGQPDEESTSGGDARVG